MAIKKSDRIKIHEKFDAHCAYCGKKIEYKDMQVDHIVPKRNWIESLEQGKRVDDIENLNPACRRCNHYKRALDLEGFRKYMRTLHERVMKNYIVKVAIDYGIVKIKPFEGKFYFEKLESEG